MATTEAARIRPHAARTRQGWTAETRARRWVIDVPLACASAPVTIVRTCRGHLVVPLVGPVGRCACAGRRSRRRGCCRGGRRGGRGPGRRAGRRRRPDGRWPGRQAVGPGSWRRASLPGRGTRQVRWACSVTSAAATSSAGESLVLAHVEDLAGGCDVAADQPEEQDLDVRGHALTVLVGADDPLTAT